MNTFRPGQIVEVTSVDMYGFLGRELHPLPIDVGVLARVEVVEHGRESYGDEEGDELDYTVLTCTVVHPGPPRVLELMDFEVSPYPI